MSETESKVAIVTGASRGIGAAIAERLARDGFAVVVNYAGQAAPAEALVGRIEAVGGRALPVQADVSDPAAVRRMFEAAEAALGGVDVLVNNAGIMILSTVAETEDAVFDRQIAVNLKGTFNTLREAATRLRPGGRIINFSSSVTGLLQPTYAVYAATKAAVEAMTSILAKELRGRASPSTPSPPARPRPICSCTARRGRSSTTLPSSLRSSDWDSPPTSLRRWPSSPGRMAAGSTVRLSVRMAEPSDH